MIPRQRIDTLIGGPHHGKQFAIEGSKSQILCPSTAGYSFARYDDVYVRRDLALGNGGAGSRVVEFYAHDDLNGERACEYLWDHLMALAGARWLR